MECTLDDEPDIQRPLDERGVQAGHGYGSKAENQQRGANPLEPGRQVQLSVAGPHRQQEHIHDQGRKADEDTEHEPREPPAVIGTALTQLDGHQHQQRQEREELEREVPVRVAGRLSLELLEYSGKPRRRRRDERRERIRHHEHDAERERRRRSPEKYLRQPWLPRARGKRAGEEPDERGLERVGAQEHSELRQW